MNECGCCGDEKFLTPGDPLPEEDPDFLLHETNRAAHRVAKAALESRAANEEATRFWRSPEPRGRTGVLAWWQENNRIKKLQDKAYGAFNAALDEYEKLCPEEE